MTYSLQFPIIAKGQEFNNPHSLIWLNEFSCCRLKSLKLTLWKPRFAFLKEISSSQDHFLHDKLTGLVVLEVLQTSYCVTQFLNKMVKLPNLQSFQASGSLFQPDHIQTLDNGCPRLSNLCLTNCPGNVIDVLLSSQLAKTRLTTLTIGHDKRSVQPDWTLLRHCQRLQNLELRQSAFPPNDLDTIRQLKEWKKFKAYPTSWCWSLATLDWYDLSSLMPCSNCTGGLMDGR